MSDAHRSPSATDTPAPYPGTKHMPQWNVAELPEAPVFEWRKLMYFLGPGLMMGGAAIGGGEWLLGPLVTAKYGGSLLWLATMSILCQVVYNIEISRYTLYTGEPIFTGKFRTLPHPMFWVAIYLVLDFGTVFPYLAANAATPVAAVILRHVPNPTAELTGYGLLQSLGVATEGDLMKWLGIGIFLLCLTPGLFGGKIYNSLKAIMTFKIFVVMGFLLFLTIFYSRSTTWIEIGTGFFKFGNVPVERGEDTNKNGRLDPGEDWDSDEHFDNGEDKNANGKLDEGEDLNGDGKLQVVEEKFKLSVFSKPEDQRKPTDKPDKFADVDGDGKPDKFRDIDSDGYRDGDNVSNFISDLWNGRGFPLMDLTIMAYLSGLVAISGQGGLSNTPTSNYTRDQGWGMGSHVGAIPSLIGGQDIQLSHVGTVFLVTPETLPRWKQWYKHIMRDQLILWAPACFVGLALPSMLSVEFLRRGTDPESNWVAAGMTADAVQSRIGGSLGSFCWFMTLFCGFLVLMPTMASTIDGFVRRWVDVFWTASKRLRALDPRMIKHVYFTVLGCYAVFGIVMLLAFPNPQTLIKIAAQFYNFAFGFSCWHVVAVNLILLPKELRPGWFVRIALVLSGIFFWLVAIVGAVDTLRGLGWIA